MLLYVTMTDVIQCKKEQFWFLLASIIFTEDLVEQDSCKRLFLGFGMSLLQWTSSKTTTLWCYQRMILIMRVQLFGTLTCVRNVL